LSAFSASKRRTLPARSVTMSGPDVPPAGTGAVAGGTAEVDGAPVGRRAEGAAGWAGWLGRHPAATSRMATTTPDARTGARVRVLRPE
jgi:hypothetical protein